MDLSNLSSGVHRLRKKKRVGRGIGSGHGKTASRGMKGQYSSAGAEMPGKVFEGGQMALFRRIPKRGFSNGTWAKDYHIVNVGDLQALPEGSVVDQAFLDKSGHAQGPADGIRVLGTGELTRKLTVIARHFSKSAREKIEKAGGKAELVAKPKPPVRNKMKPKPAKN